MCDGMNDSREKMENGGTVIREVLEVGPTRYRLADDELNENSILFFFFFSSRVS